MRLVSILLHVLRPLLRFVDMQFTGCYSELLPQMIAGVRPLVTYSTFQCTCGTSNSNGTSVGHLWKSDKRLDGVHRFSATDSSMANS